MRACLAAFVIGPLVLQAQINEPPAAPGAAQRPAAALEQFLADSDAPLIRYRALRTLEAATRGGRMHARLTAWTSLDPEGGFQYSIVEEDGSDVIRRKVLRAALEAERTMRAEGTLHRGALTWANYEFAPDNVDAGLVRIGLRPKRSDTMLIVGSMLLTEEAGDLVRVEGRLSKRPSFWTRRVEVVRQYARLHGVRVPVSMQSTAKVLIVGTSTFSMTYEYESINGEPVSRGTMTSVIARGRDN
jgi:hypothetical protein